MTSATPVVPTPMFITATLPPTSIPAPTQTASPPTAIATIAPIAGQTTTEVNVRVDTSTASESLGTIPPFTAVQIIGKDASGNWYQILFNNSTGWVRADFVQVNDASAEIPVLGAETGTGSGNRGVVLRGVNVRSGPGRDFESLGLLNQNDIVSIVAKDSSGAWMQIQYPASPSGTGWVAAEFLQIENVDAIAVLNESEPASETVETPAAVAPAQTALNEGDTANAPLATFDLGAGNVRAVQFQGEVSAPGGDVEDWLGFSSQSENVAIQVSCESGVIQVELRQLNGTPSLLNASCGSTQVMQVIPNQSYLLRIFSAPTNNPVIIKYELKIELGE